MSALREMALAIEGKYEYYYLGRSYSCIYSSLLTETGYYIHSCIKMRYKANFSPTYMLGESLWNHTETSL